MATRHDLPRRTDITELREHFEAGYRAQLDLLSALRRTERELEARRSGLAGSIAELRRERDASFVTAQRAVAQSDESRARSELQRQFELNSTLARLESEAAVVAARENALRQARTEQERFVEDFRSRRPHVRAAVTPAVVEHHLLELGARAAASPAPSLLAAEQSRPPTAGVVGTPRDDMEAWGYVERELARLRAQGAAHAEAPRFDNPPAFVAGPTDPELR